MYSVPRFQLLQLHVLCSLYAVYTFRYATLFPCFDAVIITMLKAYDSPHMKTFGLTISSFLVATTLILLLSHVL